MTYVGKILVVIQVVLTLLFMAFAGAVFSMHQNWKEKYEGEQALTAQLTKTRDELQNELSVVRMTSSTQIEEERSRANMMQAERDELAVRVTNLNAQVQEKEAQREAQTGLAESKALETQHRTAEAMKQRIENEKLAAALDAESAKVRDLQDEVFTQKVTLDDLNKRFLEELDKNAYLERVVAANNLETDPLVVEKLKQPPPPFEGLVIAVSKNRANRVEFVQLSVGSDDGLLVGQTIDVIRLNAEEGSSDWLGQVEIVDVQPDTAVARIVLPAKNGIIQVGDTATSKLTQRAVTKLDN